MFYVVTLWKLITPRRIVYHHLVCLPEEVVKMFELFAIRDNRVS